MWKWDWRMWLQNILEKWRNPSCWWYEMEGRENETRFSHRAKILCNILHLSKAILFSPDTQMKTRKWKVRKAIEWSVHGYFCCLQNKEWMLNQNHKCIKPWLMRLSFNLSTSAGTEERHSKSSCLLESPWSWRQYHGNLGEVCSVQQLHRWASRKPLQSS